MQCPRCQHGNPDDVKFCGECGARPDVTCPACRAANPPTNKFCHQCGVSLIGGPSPAPLPSPETYTPKHLAEKILTSKAVLEGERKQLGRRTGKREQAQEHPRMATAMYRDMGMRFWREQAEAELH